MPPRAGSWTELGPKSLYCGTSPGRELRSGLPVRPPRALRDTGRGPGQFQVRVGQGEIEYGRIIAQLARHQYDRLLTVEIDEMPDAPYPIDQEVRKLKYLLESLV